MIGGVFERDNDGTAVSSWSIDVGSIVVTVKLVNVGVIVDKGAVSYHRSAPLAGGVPADDETSGKPESSRVQSPRVVIEGRAVVVVKYAVDDK